AQRPPGICLAVPRGIYSSLPDLDGRPRSAGGHSGMVPGWLCFFGHHECYCAWGKRLVLAMSLAACAGSARRPCTLAADGVRADLEALRSNAPHDAYALMSSDVRKAVSFEQFSIDWKASEKERQWQAKALEESLKGNPDVGERALISFSDGKLVQLE